MIASAAAGAVTGADKAGLEGAIIGAFTGGALGAFAGMDQVPDLFSTGLSFGTGLMLNQMIGQEGGGTEGSGPFVNYSQTYGGNFDYRYAYYSANIGSQGHKLASAFDVALGKIYRGIKKGAGHFFTEGSSAVKDASKATYDIALNGPPLAKSVLALAAATEIVPAAVVAGYYAPYAATTSLVWAGSPAGQNILHGSVDFANSYFPGVPKTNWYGAAGVSASYLEDYFFD
jgi:hypothetical protein